MDLELVLRVNEPPILTESSTQIEKTSYERWERSNRLSLIFIKSRVRKSIRNSILDYTKMKEYLKIIKEQSETSDKALPSTLMIKMCSMKFNGTKGVREHIIEIRDIVGQLRLLEIEMSESFIVHFILISRPYEYGPFKISYNTHKEKWSVSELLAMCVQEEGRLNQEKIESTHLATQEKKPAKKDKGKAKAPLNQVNNGVVKCLFYKKKGHMKKSYPKFKAWLEKKGNLISLVCYESNMVHVSHNTWWIATIHIVDTMQRFLN